MEWVITWTLFFLSSILLVILLKKFAHPRWKEYKQSKAGLLQLQENSTNLKDQFNESLEDNSKKNETKTSANQIKDLNDRIRRTDNEIKSICYEIELAKKQIILSFITFLFSELALFFSIHRIVRFFNYEYNTPENWHEFVIHHFDVTGIIIGIIGILIGLLIYVVVEKSEKQKKYELDQQLQELKKTSGEINENQVQAQNVLDKLDNTVSTIKSYISSIEPISNSKDRLHKFGEIIKHADDYTNNLYLLSYAPNYGQFVLHNLNIILHENSLTPSQAKSMKQKIFYRNCLKEPEEYINENRNRILSFLDNHPSNFHFALLKNNSIRKDLPNKYGKFVDAIVLNDKEFILADPNSDLPLEIPTDKTLAHCFVHTKENGFEENNTDKKEEFAAFLKQKDWDLLLQMKKKNFEPEYLDDLPFQFFISISPDRKNQKCLGLLVFTNLFNLGSPDSVSSFSTENYMLCNSLKDMYEDLIEGQRNRDEQKNYKKLLFSIRAGWKIKFLLIEIEHKKDKVDLLVTPISDIQAKDHFIKFFMENEIEFDPVVYYLPHEHSRLNGENQKENELLSIGLFDNSLSEYLGQKDDAVCPPGKLFRLNKISDSSDPLRDKSVQIAISGNNNGTVVYSDPYSIPLKAHTDYILIARQNINNQYIWVCGGLTDLGTQYAINCFTEKHSKVIYDFAGSTQDFAAIFEIKDDAEHSTELKILSVLNKDGEIDKKTIEIFK